MKENIVYLPDFGQSGNPARCHVPTGLIEINGAVWPYLTDTQREYILNHERGHRDLHTYSETDADNYALKKMALKKPYSLWNHYQNVKSISNNNQERVHNAKIEALRIAAKDGSSEAKHILGLYGYANADGSNNIGNTRISKILFVSIAIILTILIINVLWIKRKR